MTRKIDAAASGALRRSRSRLATLVAAAVHEVEIGHAFDLYDYLLRLRVGH